MTKRIFASVGAVALAATLAACGGTGGGATSGGESGGASPAAGGEVTLRLWDEQAAEAYEAALPAFEEEHGVKVNLEVIPWADYWNTLRNDIAAGGAPDVFWTNSSNFADYAQAGKLLNIDEVIPEAERGDWIDAAVDQYTLDGTLWGVPALTDPGIAVFYNKDLLAAAGVSEEELQNLAWDPTAQTDTLREVATKLTLDSAGKTPADPDFDPAKMVQFGYNSALDTQAIYLNYLGSNGAEYQNAEGLIAFDSPEGVQAFQYMVDLINKDHVSPSAADTNDNGDFSRDQFLQGKMGLFQSGSYNLANILEGADFEWGIAPLPEGPAGRISVVNSVIAAGSTTSKNAEGQKALLEWISGPEGASALGETGVGLPANKAVQDTWKKFWEDKGVDVSPMIEVLENGAIDAPHGASIQGAMDAYMKVLKEVFLGREDVATGVAAAQEAANKVIEEG